MAAYSILLHTSYKVHPVRLTDAVSVSMAQQKFHEFGTKGIKIKFVPNWLKLPESWWKGSF